MSRLLPAALSTNGCGSPRSLRFVVGRSEGIDVFGVWATMLTDEPLLTMLLIPFTLALLERLAWISMLPTWPPVASARCSRFLKARARSFG